MTKTWIQHDGKSIPVDVTSRVNVKFRDGTDDAHQMPIPALYWGVTHTSNWLWNDRENRTPSDIVAYRAAVLQ